MNNNETKPKKKNQREYLIQILIDAIRKMDDRKLRDLYQFILHTK